jgi:nucleoside-diphosphate-sugar epimerase
MPNAIVTGCAGFIGSHLVDELLKRNWNVIGIDNFHPYYSRKLKELNLINPKTSKNFSFIEGSILSEIDLEKLPKKIDYLFHYAAIAGVRNSILNPEEYFKINLDGTKKLLSRFLNIKKIIFASTSSVYGEVNLQDFPVSENHILNPISPYGESKKQAEEFCYKFTKDNEIELAILRFYTVYGPRQRPDEAFTKFIRLILDNKPIPIYGNGKKERDFTYVSDIVNGSILAALKGNGVYNLGTNHPVTVNHMIFTIEKLMKQKIHCEYVDSPKGDVQKTHADISKAQTKLDYLPNISFEDGIKNCINWCKETQNNSI